MLYAGERMVTQMWFNTHEWNGGGDRDQQIHPFGSEHAGCYGNLEKSSGTQVCYQGRCPKGGGFGLESQKMSQGIRYFDLQRKSIQVQGMEY